MKKTLLVLFMVLCFSASTAHAAEEYVVQSFWSASHALNKKWWEPWCKEISEKSKGKVVFHYNPLNTQVKVDAVPGAIKSGTLDIGGIQMQAAVAMLPHSQALSLPFLVQDATEAAAMYMAMYKQLPEVKKELDKNFKVLAVIGSDRYAFIATNGMIKSPADISGKRVLVWAPYQMDEVKSWGGLPVQVTSTETYMGLQRGLGEIAYVPAPAIETSKLSEVAKNITLIPSRSLPLVIAMNNDSWESLPKNVQKLVSETTGDKLSKYLGQELVNLTTEDNKKHVKNGCTVYELTIPEQMAFKNAAAESNNKYWMTMLKRNGVKDPQGWINRVEKLAAQTLKH